MRTDTKRLLALAPMAAVAAALAVGCGGSATANNPGSDADPAPRFSDPTTIDNPYLPLTRFGTCTLEGEVDGVAEKAVRTTLDTTEGFEIGGTVVEALTIEDRAFEDDELVERTLDYFAQADDGTVYYLGEDVDHYEDGEVVDHDGAWRYGSDTDHLGVAMPADPALGATWRFEDVPGITHEQNEVITLFPEVETEFGDTYPDVIRVREDTSPEGYSGFKYYARDVGEIRAVEWDFGGQVELTGCE